MSQREKIGKHSLKSPGATPGRRGWILFIPLSLVPPWTESLERFWPWCLLSKPTQRQEFGRRGMCWSAPSAGHNMKGSLGEDWRQRRPTQVLASLTVRWVEQRNKSWTWQHCPMRDQGDHPSQGIKHVFMRFDNWVRKKKVKRAKIRGQPMSYAEKSSLKEGNERSLYFSTFIYRLS